MKKKKRRTGSNVTDKNQTGKRSLDGPPKGNLFWKIIEYAGKVVSLINGLSQLIGRLLSFLSCYIPVAHFVARKPINAKLESPENVFSRSPL